MAEVIHQDKRDGYIYDPVVKQFDTTFWKQTAGTTTVSSNNVPVQPTSGDSRQWGFKNPEGTTRGSVYFDITGAVFSFKVTDDFNNSTSYTLAWSDSLFSGHAIPFRIRWDKDVINVYVNNVLITAISQSTITPPSGPIAAYINNGNSDNMDVTYMLVKRAASII